MRQVMKLSKPTIAMAEMTEQMKMPIRPRRCASGKGSTNSSEAAIPRLYREAAVVGTSWDGGI